MSLPSWVFLTWVFLFVKIGPKETSFTFHPNPTVLYIPKWKVDIQSRHKHTPQLPCNLHSSKIRQWWLNWFLNFSFLVFVTLTTFLYHNDRQRRDGWKVSKMAPLMWIKVVYQNIDWLSGWKSICNFIWKRLQFGEFNVFLLLLKKQPIILQNCPCHSKQHTWQSGL